MKKIERFGLPGPNATPAAAAVRADGWLYVSGQVPRTPEGEIVTGSIAVQAKQTMDNLINALKLADYTAEDVVRVTVFLDDPRDFAGFNAVYRNYFKAEHAPARVCVLAEKMQDFKVEVDCIAWKAE